MKLPGRNRRKAGRPAGLSGARGRGGFTLIEALVVMGVIGILAAIALPSYASYVRKANRADAKAILMETAQWMERYYTTNSTYSGAPTSPMPISSTSPKGASGPGIRYNISFEGGAPAATSYTLQAIPAGDQASDSCGTLKVTNTGATTPTTAGCW